MISSTLVSVSAPLPKALLIDVAGPGRGGTLLRGELPLLGGGVTDPDLQRIFWGAGLCLPGLIIRHTAGAVTLIHAHPFLPSIAGERIASAQAT